jgi:hypothetical protein
VACKSTFYVPIFLDVFSYINYYCLQHFDENLCETGESDVTLL